MRRLPRPVGTALLLAATAALSSVLVVTVLLGSVHSLYYVPDSAQIGDVLVIALLMASTLASVVLAPPRRRAASDVRDRRALVTGEALRRSGPATAPVLRVAGAVAPISPSPSPTWRSV